MYAKNTSVSVEKSQSELRKILNRYGCGRFMIADDYSRACIMFECNGKAVRFNLPLPDRQEFAFGKRYGRSVKIPEDKAYKAWERACRSRWRALLLCIKAKLEAVEAGISIFEQEFLANFVLPGGKIFGDVAIPALNDAKNGLPDMGKLLTLPSK